MVEYRRLARIIQTLRMMVVHTPAAISDDVFESAGCGDVVLGHDMVTDVTAAFALAWQETNPFKQPVLRAVAAVVLDMVPDAEGYF